MNSLPPRQSDLLKKYVRATNYLAVAQIYLKDNVLLERPLEHSDIKPRLLGHWGTCPGINFVYANINRMIINHKAKFLFVAGPGHGFPAIQSNLFIEKSLSYFYPKTIPYNEIGIKEICSKFSAPYGYPSHSNPAAPGAILEGGELGYSLSVSFGSVLDNPDLITCCLVGDGEAETGPLAAAWNVNKLLSPVENGAVLPIIHLNGYKISGPTILGRMSNQEIKSLFEGYGYKPYFVEEKTQKEVNKNTENQVDVYDEMIEAMEMSYVEIRKIQKLARAGHDIEKPCWPVIILKTPKGWTGVKEDGNIKFEGNCKSHQVIIGDVKNNDRHLKMLEDWLKSYKFDELFDKKKNQFIPEIQELIPKQGIACGSQKYAYGGRVLKTLKMPDLENIKVNFEKRGQVKTSSMSLAGEFLKRLLHNNKDKNNLRIFSPDETYSNKIEAVFEETSRCWQWPIKDFDDDLAREGKVMEMLSEHTLFGLLHGYTVTGRHGIFISYEAFVQVIASMADQYAKFIKASEEVDFRTPLPSLNVICTSLLERQDHNGFSHQNPSFISSMMEKDGNIISAYFPPDTNSMVCTMQEIFEKRDALNIVVVGKKLQLNWLSLEEAKIQMGQGVMTWDFASDDDPQVVLVASGDYVTNECLAAIQIIKGLLPKSKIRFVNVSELTALGVGDDTVASADEFLDKYFTVDKSVIYNFHGYPHTIKKLLFDYSGASRIKVNGYLEEGSTTTPFDMETRNRTSRFHLVLDMAECLFKQGDINQEKKEMVFDFINDKLSSHKNYILEHGEDPEEIDEWVWDNDCTF